MKLQHNPLFRLIRLIDLWIYINWSKNTSYWSIWSDDQVVYDGHDFIKKLKNFGIPVFKRKINFSKTGKWYYKFSHGYIEISVGKQELSFTTEEPKADKEYYRYEVSCIEESGYKLCISMQPMELTLIPRYITVFDPENSIKKVFKRFDCELIDISKALETANKLIPIFKEKYSKK